METAPNARTLVDLLVEQAERRRDRVAFSFCPDGGAEESRLTYQELDRRARAIAATLVRQGAAGERVLVFCRPGLDSIAGFFGCFYAGAVAVPLDEHWKSSRIAAVVPEVQAGFALATVKTAAKIKTTVDRMAGGESIRWGALDGTEAVDGDPDDWAAPGIDEDTTAMVLYTSGSTGAPKGSVLTHRNLLHNLAAIVAAWNPQADDAVFNSPVTAVSWLPHYHDMGLIGAVFGTLYGGCTTVLMSRNAFIQRPIRWLQAMSAHRAVISAAPNIAYDWCVQRSTPQERAGLDLSNWSIAALGGEPVRAATLRAFADAFAPVGFRPQAFRPAYGLVEATMGVSGISDSPVPLVVHVDRVALGEDRVVAAAPEDPGAAELVGSGRAEGNPRVVIVDPATRRECGPDEVGEIWIGGPSVAQGYWGKPAETEQTFAARLADTGEGPFLRTGDRGFLRSGELFVTGRCADLVIVGGRMHYPNDIETTVQDAHPALLPGRGAAFTVKRNRLGAEQLVIVQEVHRQHLLGADGLDAAIAAIRAAVTAHHGAEAGDVVLVKPMRLPTTSSGKVQRGQCRQRFLDGDLEPVAHWQAPPPPPDPARGAKQADVAVRLARLIGTGLARQRQQTRRQQTRNARPTQMGTSDG